MTAGLQVGDRVEVEVGPIAHGGHCVARHEGQVLFVRHTLPGERVVAQVTEVGSGGRFVRADAVEVRTAAPGRIPAPCVYAARCGGCDFQHVDLATQRELKTTVVREQLTRLARLEWPVHVEALPGREDGLRWRTRAEFTVSPEREVGLRRHRSHEVIAIEDCLIATEAVVGTGVLQRNPHTIPDDVGAFDVVAPSLGEPVAVPVPRDAAPNPVPQIRERVAGLDQDFALSARGFWQVHPAAAQTFVAAALAMLAPRPGERALDLYSGVGVFAAALAGAVGPSGQVIAVESDATASGHAEGNLSAYGNGVVVRSRVDDAFGLARRQRGPRRAGSRPRAGVRHPLLPTRADIVLLDPPRTGAEGPVVAAIAALRPRAIAYIACDPAALARDLATFAEHGYAVSALRAFDAFSMTHHVECIALLEPAVQAAN